MIGSVSALLTGAALGGGRWLWFYRHRPKINRLLRDIDPRAREQIKLSLHINALNTRPLDEARLVRKALGDLKARKQ